MNFVTLHKEMIIAMKNRDKLRKDTISSLVEAVKKAAIDKKCRENIPDSLVEEVLLKEQKNMQEMIDTCPADRKETMAEYKAKMKIIKEFAPQLVTNVEEINCIICDIAKENGIEIKKENKGIVMKTVMPELKRKLVDMKVANKILSELLK